MADARRMGKSELFSHFAERFEIKRTQAREFFDELSAFNRKLRSGFDALVRERGMTLSRARVFFALSKKDGITQRELADLLGVDVKA